MKQTPFTDIHIQLGAQMHEFAGYNMPIVYTTISEEHACVRNNVGVFDVSHMGEFWVKGERALDFLQYITSNDVSRLDAGKAQYTCFPNGKGGIVDDLIIYKYSTTKYLLVVNAANIEKDWEWVNRHNTFGVTLENASDRMAQLAVQGPKAIQLLQRLTDIDLSSIPYYAFREWSFAGVQPVIISNTGYTGAGGFELYFPPQHGKQIWDALFQVGAEFGLQPIGLGARDSLRLEKWYCLYGHDIDDTTSPLEAGLGWITKFVDGKNFIDRTFLEQQKAEGVKRKLVHFQMQERAIPRNGYDICDADGNNIGNVTSGIMLPGTKTGIGMGYVPTLFAKKDNIVFIKIRERLCPATIV
ncbi:MAG: glycine cleavage system aminomethyltransferase GcvT [Paludibacter sp.]|nr:glycine cleavage system aminomethyltransferase GcvT [Bacteroidales bacterium]MCM1069005.1 glycine cleavage system aminomethyltransferase GcvT [Prevotella sp.]MCM1353668.1 glycine cleavage system aminomethyltransferase GcvT [Bacteroides sp.]MCM1441983.1 glycine cleavage system aminomethyltransferase GcvT [Muribaculum sp.]MCM1481561.1 glycine cleavage system aminomethyltransferase GcvT [Paludibacter sp.]